MAGAAKVVLITGANGDIGIELSRLVAQQGHKVWMAARNPKAGEEAANILKQEGLDVKSIQLDVTNADSIAAAKAVIEKEDGRLNVLVNNAGIAIMQYDQNPLTVDIKTVEQCMDTNFYGVIRVTQAFIPLLRIAAKAEGHATILNVSSFLGSNTRQADPNNPARLFIVAYNASKAALNSYGIALAHELKGENIKVIMGTPGFCSSKLNGYHEGGRSVKAGAESLLPWVLVGKDAETGGFYDEFGEVMPW